MGDRLRVLAFDPSSTAIGFAEVHDSEVVWSGVVRVPESWPAYFRVRSMMDEVHRVLSLAEFDRVVVEVPGKAQAGRNRGTYATPGVYAAAVGMVLARCWLTCGSATPVVTVESDHWTRSGERGWGVKKSRRNLAIASLPGYDRANDRGGDEADAIMLAVWYEGRAARCDDIYLHFPVSGPSAVAATAPRLDAIDWNASPVRPRGSRFRSSIPPRRPPCSPTSRRSSNG